MTHQTLKQGDVRKPGDEVKPVYPDSWSAAKHLKAGWQPVSPGLLNIPIDFHHVKTAEYRRPLP